MSLASARSLHLISLLLLQLLLSSPRSLGAVTHAERDLVLSCSSDFSFYNSFCYRFFLSKRAFHSAEKSCGRYHSSLVSIHSTEEEEFVMQLAENSSSFWIGLNDEDGPDTSHTEGVFKWTDGSTFSGSHQRWKFGQPDNHRHLDCVKADPSGWSMASGGCASPRLSFLCKRRACPTDMEWNGKCCQATFQDPPFTIHSTAQPTKRSATLKVLVSAAVVLITLLLLATFWWHRRTHSVKDGPTRTHLEHGIQDVK